MNKLFNQFVNKNKKGRFSKFISVLIGYHRKIERYGINK